MRPFNDDVSQQADRLSKVSAHLTTESSDDMVAHLPLAFLDALAQAKTLNDVLNCTSYWVMQIFHADRASIALQYDENHLKLYALEGNQVIPANSLIPIEGTFIGDVFSKRQLAICKNNQARQLADCQMLAAGGLLSCMDAPLISHGHCYGTLNLAHPQLDAYTAHDAKVLASLASWVAAQTHSKKQLLELERLANIDPLTGALNRRAFFTETQAIGSKPRSNDQHIGLLMIDLDSFKSINDRYGHLAGDDVLRTLSREMTKNIRNEDIFARFGGEEFALLLKNVTPHEATVIAEGLRSRIERLSVPYQEHTIRFSASIGVATPLPQDGSINDLIYRADNALYRAKQLGRNQVVVQVNPR